MRRGRLFRSGRGLWGTTAVLVVAGCSAGGQLQLPGSQASGVNSRADNAAATTARPASRGGDNTEARAATMRPGQTSKTDEPAAELKLGRKNLQLTTYERDQLCSRVVVPFELSTNLTDLLGLAGSELGHSLDDAVKQVSGDKTRTTAKAAPTTAKGVKHHISAEVRAKAKEMNWLPMSFERQYGEAMLQKFAAQGALLERDSRVGRKLYPQADALLAEVLAALKEPHDYRFEVWISTQAGENALALPGGFVVIDKALVSEPGLRDKAYFAVAHELGHVLQRHETRALQARMIDTYSMQANAGDLLKAIRAVGGTTTEAAGVLKLVTAGKLQFERHAEQQELQSDACAVRLLDGTFADDMRLRRSLQAFVNGLPKPIPPKQKTPQEQQQAALGDLVELVSRPIDRHPSTERRVQNLGVMLAEVKARKPM